MIKQALITVVVFLLTFALSFLGRLVEHGTEMMTNLGTSFVMAIFVTAGFVGLWQVAKKRKERNKSKKRIEM